MRASFLRRSRQLERCFTIQSSRASFKADVFPGFFAFDPLVLQNLCTLRKELLVKRRIFDELRLICF